MRVHIIVTVDQPEYELRSEEVMCSGSGAALRDTAATVSCLMLVAPDLPECSPRSSESV